MKIPFSLFFIIYMRKKEEEEEREMGKPIKSLTENEHHETYYEMRCVKVRDEYGDENKICEGEWVLCDIK